MSAFIFLFRCVILVQVEETEGKRVGNVEKEKVRQTLENIYNCNYSNSYKIALIDQFDRGSNTV